MNSYNARKIEISTLLHGHNGSGVKWDFIFKSISTEKNKDLFVYMLFVQKLTDRRINLNMGFTIY